MDGTTSAADPAPGSRAAGGARENVRPDTIRSANSVRPRICVVAPTPLLVVEIAGGHEDSGLPNDHADLTAGNLPSASP